ncbi:uncharacterized protein E0L32_002300 [Thyridium curvatum]|uniref:Zn(2)-C6 fungal-type domain-containing protein n=1 Tax=Thyridium curvatum TaxID=1093900 RepID=A0A507AL51_9PEZI|nr:uncharacterized protein E0L32_002300 [Thyridium curvatum]TPX06804.1 hypothetical protein E0L32_002300 [Thyridium curvatum]
MMRSISALERTNPPPRRKSCAACIKAKRRCDNGQPACLRCSRRRITCQYPSNSTGGTGMATAPATPGAEITALVPSAQVPSSDAVAENHMPTWTQPQDSRPSYATAPLQDMADTDNLSNAEILWDFLPPTTVTLGGHSASASLTPAAQQPTPAPPAFSVLSNSSTLRTVEIVAKIIDTRLLYGLEAIKAAPRQMVLEMQTPWAHASLYREGMPRCMLDAVGCCALYMAKTEANAAVVFSAIDARVRDIAGEPEPAAPAEKLARAQALLLYYIIRAFDGDISARAAAERSRPALENATLSLLSYMTFDRPDGETSCGGGDGGAGGGGALTERRVLPLHPIGPTRDFWASWVLMESTRRTFLTTFITLQMYRLLAGDLPLDCDPNLYLCHSWTLSAHLWTAADAVDFAVAWRDRRHFVSTATNLARIITEAQPDDYDTFGKIVLTGSLGIEESKGLFASRGGVL